MSHYFKALEVITDLWRWKDTTLPGISKFCDFCIHSAAGFLQGGRMSKALGLPSSKHVVQEWEDWLWWLFVTKLRTFSEVLANFPPDINGKMSCVDWHRLHLSEPITVAGGQNLISDWPILVAGWDQSSYKSCDCCTEEKIRIYGDSAIISTTVKFWMPSAKQGTLLDFW